MTNFPKSGKLEWIGIRPESRADILVVNSALLVENKGISADHYNGKSASRQVTLIQQEHINAVAEMMGMESLDPKLLRRNLVISGINLLALHNQKFYIGNVLLEGTGYCHPCSRMEQNLGAGGYNMMRGHGGITARILTGGEINVFDEVRFYDPQTKLFS